MSDVPVKMRDYDPKKGQKTQRLTWRGLMYVAGDTKMITKTAADILTAIIAADGKPLFIVVSKETKEAEEPAPKPVEIEVDDSPEEETSSHSYSSKPKRKIGRGRR